MPETRQAKWQAEMRAKHLCRSCGKRRTKLLKFYNGNERYAALCARCYRQRTVTVKLKADKETV